MQWHGGKKGDAPFALVGKGVGLGTVLAFMMAVTALSLPSLIMLKIAPGKCLPMHSHGRSELTQILRGSYNDALGLFAPGDVADLDEEVEHQPVTAPGVPCICVSALDAPLVFSGWLARKIQRFVKL